MLRPGLPKAAERFQTGHEAGTIRGQPLRAARPALQKVLKRRLGSERLLPPTGTLGNACIQQEPRCGRFAAH